MNPSGAPPVDLDRVRIDPAWALRIPVALALRRGVLPFASLGGLVHVACAEPADPDVLVIGEIRGLDSLDIAVKASLTGHLVLSTLHTNNALSAVTRLADMGLPAHLIAATLRLSVAQRLVRRLRPHCRVPSALSEVEAAALGQPGTAGRTGLFECASIDAVLAGQIARGAGETELLPALRERGFRPLLRDGAEKVLAGLTTVREVMGAVTES